MKRLTFFLLIVTSITAFAAAQTAGTEPFRQEGVASWYGGEFDGKPTASGEIFNSGFFTAAHPTLPFGTILVVTNKQNNQRVTVRVNDRGPFVSARIIDVSRAAAEVLDMLTTGTAAVIVERAANTALGPGGEPVTAAVVSQAPQPQAAPQPTSVPPPPLAAPQVTPQPVPASPEPAPQAAPQPVPVSPPVTPQVTPQPAPVSPPATSLVTPQPAPEPVPLAETTPPPVPAQPAPTYVAPPAPSPAPQVQNPAPVPVIPAYTAPAAVVRGGMPPATSTKLYRLQVGAYSVPRNAKVASDKLQAAGLKPAYEKNGNLYRVVLPKLRAGDIPSITQTLGNIGFPEALIREEN